MTTRWLDTADPTAEEGRLKRKLGFKNLLPFSFSPSPPLLPFSCVILLSFLLALLFVLPWFSGHYTFSLYVGLNA